MESMLSLPQKSKKAMEEELVRGRDMANQLLEVLTDESTNHRGDDNNRSKSTLPPFVEDLVREVLKSLTNTLLLLNNNGVSNHVASPPITVGDFSSLTMNCSKLEDFNGTNSKSLNTLNTKNRRGRSYKRKSTAPTWEKNTSILIDDGHAWRKYGQKKIMNAKHLRSYYRCTHMSDQHCQAIKHVQKIQEDPPLYRTTYYGHHTCKNSFIPDINLDPILSADSSILLSFDNNNPSIKECQISPSLLASTKREPMEVIDDDHFAQNQVFSSENLLLCDFEVYFNYLEHATMLSSTESVEFENVYEQLEL